MWTPEQEAEARAIAEEIARRPGLEWVVNSAVSLANIAATKLEMMGMNSPDPLDPAGMGAAGDAQIVIDALAGILEGVGPRLGEVEHPLRKTLAQLQMAYAERVAPPPQT